MEVTDRSVKDYLESIDKPMYEDMAILFKNISGHMPNIKPKLWEGIFWGGSTQAIIGFGDLTYTRSDKKQVEWFMVGLTLQKNYISVYISATEDGQYIVKKHGNQLGKAKIGSSSISFKKATDIKIDKLMQLVDKAYRQMKN